MSNFSPSMSNFSPKAQKHVKFFPQGTKPCQIFPPDLLIFSFSPKYAYKIMLNFSPWMSNFSPKDQKHVKFFPLHVKFFPLDVKFFPLRILVKSWLKPFWQGSKPFGDQFGPFQNERGRNGSSRVWNLTPLFPTWTKMEK